MRLELLLARYYRLKADICERASGNARADYARLLNESNSRLERSGKFDRYRSVWTRRAELLEDFVRNMEKD